MSRAILTLTQYLHVCTHGVGGNGKASKMRTQTTKPCMHWTCSNLHWSEEKKRTQTWLSNDTSQSFCHLPPFFFIFIPFLSFRFHQTIPPTVRLLLTDYTTPKRQGLPPSSSCVYPDSSAFHSKWGPKTSLCIVILSLYPPSLFFVSSFFLPNTRLKSSNLC